MSQLLVHVVSGELVGLKRSPGLAKWKVMDRADRLYDSHDQVKEDKKGKLIPSLFPPTEAEAAAFHLDRSFRILPHAQNTGGFFVAVLEKRREIGEKAAKDEAKDEAAEEVKEEPKEMVEDPETSSPAAKRQRGWQGHREAGFTFLARGDAQWTDVQATYGLADSFPAENLLHRSSEGLQKRNLYLVNAAVRQIIQANFDDIKVINSGLRVFGRVDQKYELSKFRLAHEGIDAVFPYIGNRKIRLPAADLGKIVAAEKNASERLDALSAEAQAAVGDLSEGSFCVWTPLQGHEVVALAAWRGKVTISAYVETSARLHMLRLLGWDTAALEAQMMSAKKKRQQGEAKEENGGEEAEKKEEAADAATAEQEPKKEEEPEETKEAKNGE